MTHRNNNSNASSNVKNNKAHPTYLSPFVSLASYRIINLKKMPHWIFWSFNPITLNLIKHGRCRFVLRSSDLFLFKWRSWDSSPVPRLNGMITLLRIDVERLSYLISQRSNWNVNHSCTEAGWMQTNGGLSEGSGVSTMKSDFLFFTFEANYNHNNMSANSLNKHWDYLIF